MSTCATTALLAMVLAGRAFADAGGSPETSGLTTLFVGLGAAILIFQFIPGLILFGSMISRAMSAAKRGRTKTAQAAGNGVHSG